MLLWAHDFARMLKEGRERTGHTQDSLAAVLGIDRATVSRWELAKPPPLPPLDADGVPVPAPKRNKAPLPPPRDRETVDKIAAALRLNRTELWRAAAGGWLSSAAPDVANYIAMEWGSTESLQRMAEPLTTAEILLLDQLRLYREAQPDLTRALWVFVLDAFGAPPDPGEDIVRAFLGHPSPHELIAVLAGLARLVHPRPDPHQDAVPQPCHSPSGSER